MDCYLYEKMCLSLHYCAGVSMCIATENFLRIFFCFFLSCAKGFQAEILDGPIKIMNCGIILILIIRTRLAV